MSKIALVLVNFGGPRNLQEVEKFLIALLTDSDVIRTPLPNFLQKLLFTRAAKKRAPKIAEDYAKIGGGSPIFADTEWLSIALKEKMSIPVLAFHRYLVSTHSDFIASLHGLQAEKILVFPLFPQFSYVTTGSVARWFSEHVRKDVLERMDWISSYFCHDAYIDAFCFLIEEFLQEKGLEEVTLLFSAHGLPEKYVSEGDPYQKECEGSFRAIAQRFPKHRSLLAYQSQFGRGKWLSPSTLEICENPKDVLNIERPVVFIPLSFSSDHIETLFEVEEQYIKPLKNLGFSAYRCPALGRREDWVNAIIKIIETKDPVGLSELIRSS